jgi:hypothetical protein
VHYDQARRATRLLLDIHAKTPIILIPINKQSNELLVFKLGDIKINNKFLVDGEQGTLNYQKYSQEDVDDAASKSNCMLDVISIQFTDTDLYSALRYDLNSPKPDEMFQDYSIRFCIYKLLLFLQKPY